MVDKAHEDADKTIEELKKEIEETYRQAYDEMIEKQARMMEQYASGLEEMNKKLEAGEIKESEFEAWKRGRALDAMRTQGVIDRLADDLVNADVMANEIVAERTPEVFANNVNYATYVIETKSAADTAFALYSVDTVKRLLSDNPDLLPDWKVDEVKDKNWSKKKIASSITQSILQGESVPNAAKRLKSVVEMSRSAAFRTARTAITSAENGGRLAAMKRAKEMGIEVKKVWEATLDSRTRVEHRMLDGQVAEVDEPFTVDGIDIMCPGDASAPGRMVYNCRCTLLYQVAGFDLSKVKRSSKLDVSYEEWKEGK